ncbi:hypothetical protein [Exiguobacterium flavidum]|uniref:hypothetical protein n=1 Tax=Exiguobacterium flavidum TaxID=2184695 RepID=UPI00130075B4|nr:hypothetical protein [Exiguobacterium flavidum]
MPFGHRYVDGLFAVTGWDSADIDALIEERLAILARRKILLALDVGTDTEYVINLQTED